MTLQWTLTKREGDCRIMFVFYKETPRTLKNSPVRKKRKASTLLSSTSSIKTVTTTLHRCCNSPSTPSSSISPSVSPTVSYSVLLFSAADILFRLTEGFVGQVEEVQKNCFRKIMNSRYSKQENSSIYSSNRSRRQQSIPFNQQPSSHSHSDHIPKSRCFCWCCCCSCLWQESLSSPNVVYLQIQ